MPQYEAYDYRACLNLSILSWKCHSSQKIKLAQENHLFNFTQFRMRLVHRASARGRILRLRSVKRSIGSSTSQCSTSVGQEGYLVPEGQGKDWGHQYQAIRTHLYQNYYHPKPVLPTDKSQRWLTLWHSFRQRTASSRRQLLWPTALYRQSWSNLGLQV